MLHLDMAAPCPSTHPQPSQLALPAPPATTRVTPHNVPLPDSDSDDQQENEDKQEEEEQQQPDPTLLGQFDTPSAGKAKATKAQKSNVPSYAQPTRTSMCKKKPSEYIKWLEVGEDTINGRAASGSGGQGSRKKKSSVAAAITHKSVADFAMDCAFLLDLAPILATAINDAHGDPGSVEEVRSRSDWPLWQQAMDHEMKTLADVGTWETVSRPTGQNIVGSKWVFQLKCKADRSVDKYKARLIARGFTQVYGTDYFETYLPITKLTSS